VIVEVRVVEGSLCPCGYLAPSVQEAVDHRRVCERHKAIGEGWQWVDAVVCKIVPPAPVLDVDLGVDTSGFYKDMVQVMAEQRIALAARERSLLDITNLY
jgi:hypothetical protein